MSLAFPQSSRHRSRQHQLHSGAVSWILTALLLQEPLPNLTEAIPGEAKFTLRYSLGLKLALTACNEKKILQQL